MNHDLEINVPRVVPSQVRRWANSVQPQLPCPATVSFRSTSASPASPPFVRLKTKTRRGESSTSGKPDTIFPLLPLWDLESRVNASEVFLAVMSRALRSTVLEPLNAGDGAYRIIESRFEALMWVESRTKGYVISLDIEGNGNPDTVHPSEHEILCLGLCDGFETVILPEELFDSPWPEFADALEKCVTVAHNGKFDAGVLGFNLRGKNQPIRLTHDTMLAHYALWPAGAPDGEHVGEGELLNRAYHGLKLLGDLYLACGNWSLSNVEYQNMRNVPLDRLYQYNAWDVQRTYLLLQIFRDQFRHRPKQLRTYMDVLMPASHHLGWMEGRGITVDVPYVEKELIPGMTEDVDQLTHKLIKHADGILPDHPWPLVSKAKRMPDEDVKSARRFNPGSANQVRAILESQGVELPVDRKSKTGKGSTSQRNLNMLLRTTRKGDPFLTDLLERRRTEKLLSTYAVPLSKAHTRHPFQGTRLFPTFHLHRTLSGRLASSGPNIQNQPKYKPIRKSYRSRGEGYVVVQSDYGQAELRVMAVLGRDEFLKNVFHRPDVDLFDMMMINTFPSINFGGNMDKFKKEHPEEYASLRRQLKTVVYGVSYARGAFDIAEDLEVDPIYAQKLIDDYLGTVKGVARWRNTVLDHITYSVPLVTRFGRYLLHEKISEGNVADIQRRALSFLPQSSASDCCLLAAINLGNFIRERNLDWEMTALIHDAIILDVPEPHKEDAAEVSQKFMTDSAKKWFPEVPFAVDSTVGETWADL